jgi:pyrroline-5-carboxylate reductase
MKILIIGGGNMGLTYANSFLNARIVTDDKMIILEKSPEKAEKLKELKIGTVYGTAGPYIKEADLIILAVKPQDIDPLFDTIKDHIDKQQVFLSIMAGIKIETISSLLGITKVIRAMPNLPAQIGEGMTVFTSSDDVTRIELVTVQNLINATGKSMYVEKEMAIDAATALSGSGPAYVFYFMNAMMETAQSLGFKESEAELLIYQTFSGAIDLYNKHNFSCSDWISKVASRGGTTEAAINTFGVNELPETIDKGIRAAYKRADELSKLNK